ncbi:MAG: hypothetical protein C0432_04560 [Candidatus Puniceispirillum sp.]|nr:hypothetical protein [Candidatus Pelagibacter sp.]MBA4283548.1 hypothetical protein [Candidatus Puniceispirillum sp.]
MKFILHPLLFIFCAHQSFSASFDRLQDVVHRHGISADLSQIIYEKISGLHQKMADEQNDLYVGVQHVISDNVEPASASAKSAKSKGSSQTSKSKNSDLLNANFALAYLCVVTAQNELLEIPVYNMDSQLMYDSCFEGMHNLVPGEGSDLETGLDTSINQWTRYLGANPFILNAGTESVKNNILSKLQEIKQLVSELKELCNDQKYDAALESISSIEDGRQKYFGYLRKWTTSGWHNEQRIIADMDSSRIKGYLQAANNDKGIKLVIACVHTRLAPCIAAETYASCDCYHCLQNWPMQWNLNQQYPSIMTTSYVSYPKSSSEQVYLEKQQQQNNNVAYYFMKQCVVSTEITPSDHARKWLQEELAFHTSQINYLKTGKKFGNFFDQAIVEVFQPILDVCKVSYVKKQLCIESSQFSLKRKDTTLLLDGYVEVPSAKLRFKDDEEDIVIEVSEKDNDWVLLLKSYLVEHFKVFKQDNCGQKDVSTLSLANLTIGTVEQSL